jgi:putative inorganic carbon (hco3(-)) transporter
MMGFPAPSRAARDERVLVAAIAGSVALAAFAAAARDSGTLLLGFTVVSLLPLAAAVRDPRRVLLGAIMFDVLLQWDVNLGYEPAAGALGAEAGLNLSLTTLALAGLLGVWASESVRPLRAAPRWRIRPAVPLIAFTAACALSVPLAPDPELGVFYLAMLVQALLLFIYVSSSVTSRGDILFVVDALLAAVALEGVLMLVTATNGWSFDVAGLSTTPSAAAAVQLGGEVRAIGTLRSPNTAAAVLEMLLPVALAAMLVPVPRRTRRLATAAFTLGLPALVLTGSRGGLIAFVVAVVVLGVAIARRHGLGARRPLVAMVVAGLLLAVAGAPALSRLIQGDAGSAGSRVPLARLAVDMIESRPVLGVGLNNFAVSIPTYAGPSFTRQWVYTVHDRFLLIWSESGPLALLAFLWFLGAALRRGLRIVRRAQDALVAALAAAIVGAVAGSVVHMTVEIFSGRAVVELLWILTALLVGLERLGRAGRRT